MADVLLYNQIATQNQNLSNEIAAAYAELASLGAATTTTWDPKTWTSLPLLRQANLAGELMVHSTILYGCGQCCQWTVPAGASRAQFQIWGAGSNGTGAQCCGLGFLGTSGAYATTIISVTPGDTYTLCSGCSSCCCLVYGALNGFTSPCSHFGATQLACPSFVTGNGLSNFCANGGLNLCICRWYQAALIQKFGTLPSGTCNIPTSYVYCNLDVMGTSGGGLYTPGPWICVAGNLRLAGRVPFVSEPLSTFYGTTYGVNGIYPALHWSTSEASGTSCHLVGKQCFAPSPGICTKDASWYGFDYFNGPGQPATNGFATCYGRTGCVTLCDPAFGRGGSFGVASGGNCGSGSRAIGGLVRVSWC